MCVGGVSVCVWGGVGGCVGGVFGGCVCGGVGMCACVENLRQKISCNTVAVRFRSPEK
jgi:hypothetical protein